MYLLVKRILAGPIARATARTSVVLGARLLTQALALVLVARLLGPEGMGVYAGLAAFALLLGTLSTFGTHLMVLAEVSRDLDSPTLRTAPVTTACVASVLIAVYLCVAGNWVNAQSIETRTLIAIAFNDILVVPAVLLFATPLQARGKIALSQVLTTLPIGVRVLAALGALCLDAKDPLGLYAWSCLAANSMLVASLAWHGARDNLLGHLRTWRLPRRAELRQMAAYASLNVTAAGPPEIDKMLALHTLPVDAAGVYSAASRIVGASSTPVIAMMVSAMPRLFRLQDEEAGAATSRRLLNWIMLSSIGYGLVIAGALWMAAPLVGALFGEKYQRIADIVRWLVWIVLPLSLRIAGASSLMALGKPWTRAAAEFIGIIFLSSAGATLATRYGTAGLVAAVALTELAMATLAWYFVMKTIRS